MSDHVFQPIERHCDVAVVGGSAAGLAAALQLGRQRRSVIVIDAGEPRNVPAADEVRRHGGEILAGGVSALTRTDDGRIRLELSSGHSIVAPDWDIEVHEKRPRPPGAASTSHHVDDIVLRARRRPHPPPA